MVSESPTSARQTELVRRIISWAALIALFGFGARSAFDLLLTFRTPSHDSTGWNINPVRAYGNLPVSFEPNHGQTDKKVKTRRVTRFRQPNSMPHALRVISAD